LTLNTSTKRKRVICSDSVTRLRFVRVFVVVSHCQLLAQRNGKFVIVKSAMEETVTTEF